MLAEQGVASLWKHGYTVSRLDVGVETAKLKSANIISPTTCNDVMRALALLAPIPSSALLRKL